MGNSWREKASPIIARVLKECEGKTVQETRKALRAAWPFGPYEMYPLKIWRDEINRQIGRKPPLGWKPVKAKVTEQDKLTGELFK